MGRGPGISVQAMASMVVPMWGAAGTASKAGIALAGLRASLLLLPGLLASLLLAQHSVMIKATACGSNADL